MQLTQADCENLIDALQEWNDSVGPKVLDDGEAGLDSDRFEDLMGRLGDAVHAHWRRRANDGGINKQIQERDGLE